MNRDSNSFVVDYLTGFKHCIDHLPIAQIAAVADCLLAAHQEDRLVAIIGNGGSAATASHIACDLSKTILGKRPTEVYRRFRVLPLTDNMPLVTAWANDVDYKLVFAEQLRGWVRPGDVVIAITGSGNSPNICEGILTAKALGAYTIGFLGFDGGDAREMVDLAVLVPSDNYGHIEDMHMMFGHMVTAYIRNALVSEPVAQGHSVYLNGSRSH